jgi:4-nitrophenyl phosphatase
MDGVLWRGDEALPGLVPFFEAVRARGLPFALATNNSSKAPADYVRKLERMGVTGVEQHQIVTSGTATASYLQAHYAAGTPIHILGGDGLRQIMTEAGFTLSDHNARAVVVGLDPHLTYDKLKRAALLIRGGADFIASNEDATIPTPEGLAPGAGSIIAALKAATEQQPIAIGKPNPPLFKAALRALNTPAERTLMIGDRLNTDIAGAKPLGLRTALVLTGVATREDIITSGVEPDGVYDDLATLNEGLREKGE